MRRFLIIILAVIGSATAVAILAMGGMMAVGAASGMGDMMGMSGMMGGGSAPTVGSATGQGAVAISGFAFKPTEIDVTQGTTIIWTNDDGAEHTVTANGGAFASGTMSKGASFRHRFDAPGTYGYICSIHPWMSGTVVVSP